MAGKGNSRHMKSLNTSDYPRVHKKGTKYIAKPTAGRHTLDRCISILGFLKSEGIAETARDARGIANSSSLSVNWRRVSNIKYPIGVGDVVTLNGVGSFSIGIDQHAKASFVKLDAEPKDRLCRVIRKYKAAKGVIMLGLNDGSVVLGSNESSVNDSVKVNREGKIVKTLKLDKGAKCLIIDGVHVGTHGSITSLTDGGMHTPKAAGIKSDEGAEFETLVKNIMVMDG